MMINTWTMRSVTVTLALLAVGASRSQGQALKAEAAKAPAAVTAAASLTLATDGKTDKPVPLRILPVGDSITRGSYLTGYATGPFKGDRIGLPNPDGGGWRKVLQDRLRAAGVAYQFVGELDYRAFGADGVVDARFDPHHHGLAGFDNQRILSGGVVPTPADILTAKGVKEIRVRDIVTVLQTHRPNVILLMSGTNSLDPAGREKLVRTILEHCDGDLFVATIPPQAPPRPTSLLEQVDPYNRNLAPLVNELAAIGKKVHLVDIHAALAPADLLGDGVHPNRAGMEKIALAWFRALQTAGLVRGQ